jgi:uncharacterized protein (TIGR02271 family)
MQMIRTEDVQQLLASGGTVVDQEGTKIGDIGQVFLDDQTSEPEWVTVKTGMFGGAESFVPLADATISGTEIHVPFTKSKVKDAPRVDDSEGHLSRDEESELYRYYDMSYSDAQSDSGLPAGGVGDSGPDTAGTVGRDTSGPTTDDAMTRSEEQVNIGTERVSAGKVRLRKYVVTENVTQTVPVSHEEVRIEREPITDANRGDAVSGGDITSEEHEVELTEERVVVDKKVVPVERVRLDTEVVTEEQQVSEEVRKEQIETDTA